MNQVIYAKSIKAASQSTKKLIIDKFSQASNGDVELHSAALYALMGGYNQVARGVDLDEYHMLRDKFDDVVSEMAALIAGQK